MASITSLGDSDLLINKVRNFIKVVRALKKHNLDISSTEGLRVLSEIICLGLEEFKAHCTPKESSQSCGDQELPTKTEQAPSCGDQELPAKTEQAQSCGDQELPAKTEQAQSCGDQELPDKTEQAQSCGDQELPAKTEQAPSCGDQELPGMTEQAPSCGDQELPAKTEQAPSCGDQELPAKTEQAPSSGDQELPAKIEQAPSCGDQETLVEIKKTHDSCNRVEDTIRKSEEMKWKKSDGPSKATNDLAISYLQQLWDDIQEEFIMKENDLEIMLEDYGDILLCFSVTKLCQDMMKENTDVADCVWSNLSEISKKLEKILEVIIWHEDQQEIKVKKDQNLPDKKLNKEKDCPSTNEQLKRKDEGSQRSTRINPMSKGHLSAVTIREMLSALGICDTATCQGMSQDYVSRNSTANLRKSIYDYLFSSKFSVSHAQNTEKSKEEESLKSKDSFKEFASKYLIKTKKESDYILCEDLMKYYCCWCNQEDKVPSTSMGGGILASYGIYANRCVDRTLGVKQKYAYTCVAWTERAFLEELVPKAEQVSGNTTDNINKSSHNFPLSFENSSKQPSEKSRNALILSKDSFSEFASKYLIKTNKITDCIHSEDLTKYYRCWCNLEGKVPSSTVMCGRILASMGIRANHRVSKFLDVKQKYAYTCVGWTNTAFLELFPRVEQISRNTTENVNMSSYNFPHCFKNSTEQYQPIEKTKINHSSNSKNSFNEFTSKYLMKTNKESDCILCEDLTKYYRCWCNLEGKVPSSTLMGGRILASMGIRANHRVSKFLDVKQKYAYTCVGWTNTAFLELFPRVDQISRNTTENVQMSSYNFPLYSKNSIEQYQPIEKTNINHSSNSKNSFNEFVSKYLMKTNKESDCILCEDLMKYYRCWCNLEGKVPSSTIMAGKILASMGICANRRFGGSLSIKQTCAYTCIGWTKRAFLEELVPKAEQVYENTTDNINKSSHNFPLNFENSSKQHQPTEKSRNNFILKSNDSFKEFASKYLIKTNKKTDNILCEDLTKYYRCWCNLEGKVPSSTVMGGRILASMGIRANHRVTISLYVKKYAYTCVGWTNTAFLELFPRVDQISKNTTENVNMSSYNFSLHSKNSTEQYQPTEMTKINHSSNRKDSFKEFASKYLMKTSVVSDYILCEDLIKYYQCWCNLEGKVPAVTTTVGKILSSMGIYGSYRRVCNSHGIKENKYAYTGIDWTDEPLPQLLVQN